MSTTDKVIGVASVAAFIYGGYKLINHFSGAGIRYSIGDTLLVTNKLGMSDYWTITDIEKFSDGMRYEFMDQSGSWYSLVSDVDNNRNNITYRLFSRAV
jgi:hypothetical protein